MERKVSEFKWEKVKTIFVKKDNYQSKQHIVDMSVLSLYTQTAFALNLLQEAKTAVHSAASETVLTFFF